MPDKANFMRKTDGGKGVQWIGKIEEDDFNRIFRKEVKPKEKKDEKSTDN